MKTVKIISLFCALWVVDLKGIEHVPGLVLPTNHKGGLPFLSSKDQKKRLAKKRARELTKFQTQSFEEQKKITHFLQEVEDKLIVVKGRTEEAGDRLAEFYNKKITILNEIKQNLQATQELFEAIEKTIQEHIIVINNTTELLDQFDKELFKKTYSWKEFKEAEVHVQEVLQKKQHEEAALKKLIVERNREREAIKALKQQFETKNKELERVPDQATQETQTVFDTQEEEIKQSIATEERRLIELKIAYTTTKMRYLEEKVMLKEDEVDFLKHQFRRQENNLSIIKQRAQVQLNDVKISKNSAIKEREKAIKEQEALDALIAPLKKERAKLLNRKHALTLQTKEFEKEEDEDRRETINYFVLKAELKKVRSHVQSVESEINHLQAKKTLLDVSAKQKEAVYDRISTSHKIQQGKDELDLFIENFKPIKQMADSALEDYKKSAKQPPIKTENIKKLEEKLAKKKDILFISSTREYQICLKHIQEAKKFYTQQLNTNNEAASVYEDIIKKQEEIVKDYTSILDDLTSRKTSEGLWKRSPKAISFEAFAHSLLDIEFFFRQLFWDTPVHLGPSAWMIGIKKLHFEVVLGIVLFLIMFFFLFICLRLILGFILKRAKMKIASDRKYLSFLSLNIIIALLEFSIAHLPLLVLWGFVFLHVIFKFVYVFSTISFLNERYYVSLFYLLSIPTFVYLSGSLLVRLKELNRRLSFFFFAEQLQDRFILLITCFCYATTVLLPLRLSFISYFGREQNTIVPDVIIAAYTLILVVVLLLFFSKEDVLRLIPSRFAVFVWIKKQIDKHYYPAFLFLMSLLILSNPYIGYSNLAWFLAFAVPSTVLIVYGLFLAHHWIRNYSVFLFIKEEDEEIIDKFEHAKTYYGLLVISSFIVLLLITFILATRIWGFTYTPSDLWRLFTEVLVIPVGKSYRLGFIELFLLVVFITAGFFTSSLTHRFILTKLFDILRTEPGMQNTFSKILHYFIILFATILGFTFIHLEPLLWYIGTSLAVAGGFAIKDIVSDYVAGFFVLIERPLEIGNFVRIDKNPDIQGTVHKIDGRTTTLINKYNHAMIVPNKDLIMKQIDNWGKGRFAIGFDISILVDYEMDPEFARNTIMEVVQANQTILRVPRIVVRIENLTEHYIEFLARVFISSRRVKEQWAIAAEIREEIIKMFRKKGIKFAFPQHVIHLASVRYSEAKDGKDPQGPISFNFDK